MNSIPPNDVPQREVKGAIDLSTAFAELLPREPDDVGPFITEAAYALGLREADLARLLNVSHPTLSSWKSRGVVPEQHLLWFTFKFVSSIFRSNLDGSRKSLRNNQGVEVALSVFQQTDFDPFRQLFEGRQKRVEICSRLIDPISRLGLFVMRRLEQTRGDQSMYSFLSDRVTPKVIELAWLGTMSFGGLPPGLGPLD